MLSLKNNLYPALLRERGQRLLCYLLLISGAISRVYNGEGDILEDRTEYNEVNPLAWKVEKVGSINYKVKMNDN
jgi:hypothetical protein